MHFIQHTEKLSLLTKTIPMLEKKYYLNYCPYREIERYLFGYVDFCNVM